MSYPLFLNFGVMRRAFIKYLEKNCRAKQDDKFFLAVSGGVDSVVLASLFHHFKLDFGIAHMNFSLRGKESDEDAAFVAALAKRFEVPFFLKDVDTKLYASQKKLSIQEAARELRYDWLDKLRHTASYDYIVLGHHADDEIETFFINLLRGTGINGLTGYAPKAGAIIRPLLFCGREEILEFAKAEKLSWREDSSNAGRDYLRNAIRHDLLPRFYDLRPGSRNKMLENIRRIQSEAALLGVYTERPDDELEGSFRFSFPVGMPEEAIPAFLQSVLAKAGFNFSQFCDMAECRDSEETRHFYSASHEVSIRKGEVEVRLVKEKKKGVYLINDPQELSSLPVKLEMEIMDVGDLEGFDQGEHVALLDAERVKFPLELRKRRDGDRFRPLGLDGSKKLSDFLMGLKLSSFEKDDLWLLTSGGLIVWVLGYRIDHRFRVNAKTKKVLRVVVEQ